MLLNHFNASLLQRFAYEHLKDWLDLEVVIEKVRVNVSYLDGLIIALLIRYVSRTRRSIDVVVGIDLRLIDHIVAIVELYPVMHGLHLHLLLLSVHLLHLLLLLLLGELIIVVTLLGTIHLLLLHHLLLLLLVLYAVS